MKLLLNEYAFIATRLKVDGPLHTKIDIDIAFRKLHGENKLSGGELQVLNAFSLGHTVSSGAETLSISRWKFRKLLTMACTKLVDVLGWEYSDQYVMMRKNK